MAPSSSCLRSDQPLGACYILTGPLFALVVNKTYIWLSKISCAFCGHTRKVSKTLNKHQLEVVHTTVYTIKEHLSFGKFYGRIEYDYDTDEKGRKL